MISKNQLKLINSLAQKKYRRKHQLFLVQGEKNVLELLQSNFELHQLFATDAFYQRHSQALKHQHCVITTPEFLQKAGTLQTNDAVLALVKTPALTDPKVAGNELALVLDGVSDPGNLGTIIRLADWYGIKQVIASEDCADCFNPKVISASMGSFARVSVHYTGLAEFLSAQSMPVYGAFLEGENLHRAELSQQGFIVLGSESHGIRPEVARYVNRKITIPNFGQAESLNVAMAGAIILDNFKR